MSLDVSQPPPAPSSEDGPDKWPPSLREYIERAFQKCDDDIARNLMEGELKKVITGAIQKKELKTKVNKQINYSVTHWVTTTLIYCC